MTTPECVHHWVISTPVEGKKKSTGICKKCGASDEFPNGAQPVIDTGWRRNKPVRRKRA